MLSFNSIMIGTTNAKALADFYEKVFQKPADQTEGGWYGWQIESGYLSIGEHSDVRGKAKEPQRVILNFETKEVKKEFERIKSFGASVIKEPYEINGYKGFWIATFADPDGNYFQLMTPWEK